MILYSIKAMSGTLFWNEKLHFLLLYVHKTIQ